MSTLGSTTPSPNPWSAPRINRRHACRRCPDRRHVEIRLLNRHRAIGCIIQLCFTAIDFISRGIHACCKCLAGKSTSRCHEHRLLNLHSLEHRRSARAAICTTAPVYPLIDDRDASRDCPPLYPDEYTSLQPDPSWPPPTPLHVPQPAPAAAQHAILQKPRPIC